MMETLLRGRALLAALALLLGAAFGVTHCVSREPPEERVQVTEPLTQDSARVPVWTGAPERNVRLLLKGDYDIAEQDAFAREKWSRILGLPRGKYQFRRLYVFNFSETDSITVDRRAILPWAETAGGPVRSVDAREVIELESLSPEKRLIARSLVGRADEDVIQIPPGSYHVGVVLLPAELRSYAVDRMKVLWNGREVEIEHQMVRKRWLDGYLARPDPEFNAHAE